MRSQTHNISHRLIYRSITSRQSRGGEKEAKPSRVRRFTLVLSSDLLTAMCEFTYDLSFLGNKTIEAIREGI
jgi:hypothetical protein